MFFYFNLHTNLIFVVINKLAINKLFLPRSLHLVVLGYDQCLFHRHGCFSNDLLYHLLCLHLANVGNQMTDGLTLFLTTCATDNGTLYIPGCVSTMSSGLSLGSGLTCCLSSWGGRSTMVTKYGRALQSKLSLGLVSSIFYACRDLISSSTFNGDVFKLSKFRAPTSSQILHSPAISTISLKFPAFSPSKNFVLLIGLLPCLEHSSLYFS